jgi:hypothetical protein
MAKLFLKISAAFLILISVGWVGSRYLDCFFTESFRAEKEFWVMNQQHKDCDFAVLGSSRACNAVDITEMERCGNLSGVNIGVSGTNYAGNYLMLQRFLNQENRIKTLMIQVDIFGLDSKHSFSNPFRVQNYLPYLDVDPCVDRVVKENSSRSRYLLWKHLPLAKYVEFNTEYLKYFSKHVRKNFEEELYKNKGYIPITDGHAILKASRLEKNIDMRDFYYLTKIIEYAQDKGIGVILFTSPQYFTVKNSIKTYGTFSDFVDFLCATYDVPYFSFEDAAISYDKKKFSDATHTNSAGSREFSRLLAWRFLELKGKHRDEKMAQLQH